MPFLEPSDFKVNLWMNSLCSFGLDSGHVGWPGVCRQWQNSTHIAILSPEWVGDISSIAGCCRDISVLNLKFWSSSNLLKTQASLSQLTHHK